MVVRSLVKLARLSAPKQSGGGFKGIKVDYYLPGLTGQEVRHHFGLIPLYIFTAIGSVACIAYCVRLATVADCVLFKSQKRREIETKEQIPLFMISGDIKDAKAIPDKVKLPLYIGEGSQ